jgi:hypothetical protein
MNDVKIYDSSSIPNGDFFHKQWAKPIVMLDGEPISSDIEDIELEIPGDMKLDSVPQLHEVHHSFTIELSKEESDKLSRVLWLDKMEWLTHQLNTVWKNKFFKT